MSEITTTSIDRSSTEHHCVRVSDATLRDSAHMAGVHFTPEDAKVIAGLLAQTHVDEIEAGVCSAADKDDLRITRTVCDVIGPERTMTLVLVRNRKQMEQDLPLACSTGAGGVLLSVPTSEEHAALKLGSASPRLILNVARVGIELAKDMGLQVAFSAEDGARTDPGFLAEYVASGAAAGADRFRLAETVATLLPAQCAALVEKLVAAANGMAIDIHSHNMLGLAVANALAAVAAGATWISATVNGLGERGGNTPLAEVLCLLSVHHGDDSRDLTHLSALSREVAKRAGVASSASTGPTAELAFAYEAAGHVLHPEAFEAVPPELVGNERHIRVGKRLKPALLRSCLGKVPPEVDLEAATADLLASLDHPKATLTLADIESYIARRPSAVA